MRTVRERGHRLRMPLAVVVGRYFVYILIAGATVLFALAVVATGMFTSGFVLPANYAEQHVDTLVEELAGQEAFDPSDISAAFRYVVLSPDGGAVRAADCSDQWVEEARRSLVREQGSAQEGAAAPDDPMDTVIRPHRIVHLKNGDACVLFFGLMPQWADRDLRDHTLDPQTLFLAVGATSLTVIVVVVALRASHVLTRKMDPLVAAARAVGARDLDVPVGSSNIAQIDDVLAAMDDMRASLKRSLEQQWEDQQRQREQVTLLAHRLKTPLTVLQGNTELLLEDSDVEGLSPEARGELEALRAAALEANACVGRLIAASRGMTLPPEEAEARRPR